MRDLNKTSSNVNSAMKEVQKATGDTANSMSDLTDIAKDTNNSLKDTNGAADQAAKGIKAMGLMEAGQKMMEFGSKIIGVIGNLMDLTEATQEFNTLQGKLEGSAAQFGYDANMSKDLAKGVYKYTGDEMAATNVVTNLQAMKLPKNELKGMVDAAEAAWTAFGDSIPIESITESINETAQVGKVTGALADAINWTAAEEDAFNQQLSACNSTQERAALIQDMLNGRYGESKTSFDEANQAIMDYRGSVYDTMDANAQLGEAFAPINSAINQVKSAIAEALAPVIEDIAQKFQPIIDKVKQFIQDNPQLVATIGAVVGVLGVLAAVIGPILIAGGLLVTVFGAISAPILIVIGVITALIAIGIALWANWDTICQKATQLKDWVIGKWNELKDAVINAATILKDWVVEKFNQLKDGVLQIIDTVKQWMSEKWNAIWTTITGVCNSIKTTVTNAFNTVKEKVTGVIDEIKGIWDNLKSSIENNPIIMTVKKVTESLGNSDTANGNNTYQGTKSHAAGLQRVPYNNYIAKLHMNEAVLSRRDADKWREGKGNSSITIAKIADTVIIREEADLDKFAEKFVRKLNQQRIITNG